MNTCKIKWLLFSVQVNRKTVRESNERTCFLLLEGIVAHSGTGSQMELPGMKGMVPPLTSKRGRLCRSKVYCMAYVHGTPPALEGPVYEQVPAGYC